VVVAALTIVVPESPFQVKALFRDSGALDYQFMPEGLRSLESAQEVTVQQSSSAVPMETAELVRDVPP
jgi:hypothetical protein